MIVSIQTVRSLLYWLPMKRLYRSEKDRMVAGVCGGMAEYFEVDSTVVRAGWVIVTLLTAIIPMLIAYLLLILIMPTRSKVQPPNFLNIRKTTRKVRIRRKAKT